MINRDRKTGMFGPGSGGPGRPKGARNLLKKRFIEALAKEFDEHGTVVEKYDVRRRESDVAADIRFGYSANQIGFGWTNGAVLELLAGMRPAR